MKRITILTALFLFAFMGFAQEWHGITSDSPSTMKKTLISSTENEIVVEVSLGGFYTQNLRTPEGKKVAIDVNKMAAELEAGAPQLPHDAIPVIIGDRAEMSVSVVNSTYVDYENVEVAPSKGNISRQVNPEDVPYVYGEMYSQNAFWPATQAYLEHPYILRDFRGQNIMVYPFAYNPVTKTLRVYTSMTIAMTKVSDNGENQKSARKSSTIKMDPEQKAMYDRRFLNFGEMGAKYPFDEDFGEMLIICTDAYMSNLQPLVEWKNQSGRPTTLVSLSTAGGNNSTNIKNYIQSVYDDPNHNLEFILLVGEYSDLTPYVISSDKRSDNWFGKLEGSDNYLDALVGRLSVSNAADADLQVNKIIYYERDVEAGAAWGNKGMGIGYHGAGTGHYGEDDYQHIDFIRDTLMHYTYATVTEHHGGSGGDASVATISGTINQGISIINYCNHGSVTSWGVASYSVSDVSALTNDGKLPFVWSVACLNGQFDTGTCFGESWLRAKNNASGAPTGAIGGMFSWISQPWVPPMYGQDEMVNILTEHRSTNLYNHTLGGVSLNGSMDILDKEPNDSYETFNTWLLFGDPSLIVRTDVPTDMNVTLSPSILMLGMSELEITADAAYGIATLSMNGEVIASERIVNGACTMSFPGLTEVGTADLVIVGYNKATYMGSIEVVPAEGPYVTVNSYQMNVNQANYGETIDMSIDFKNVGVETTSNVTITLSTENEYVNITNAEGSLATIAPDEIITVEGFQFAVAANVPDGTTAQFDVNITNGTDTWNGKIMIDLHAPVIAFAGIETTDDNVMFRFTNAGSAAFEGGTLVLTSCSPDLVFDPEMITSNNATQPGDVLELVANYAFDPSVEEGTTFEVSYEFTAGLFTIQDIFVLSYGKIMEDFESGEFSSDWTLSSTYAWTIEDGGVKGTKCAKSSNAGVSNSEGFMQLAVTVFAEGELKFMYKVSSEQNWDKLKFYMDGNQISEWSGSVNWTQYTMTVTPGNHTFKWSYSKDGSVNTGDDCAWVDNIILPPTNVITFIAPATNLEYTVNGHDVELTWTASADATSYVVKRDDATVATVNTTEYTDVVEVGGTYKYSVYAQKADGSMSAPVTVMVPVQFEGIAESEANFGIYPNPAENVLNIKSNTTFEYQMINSVGQVVMSGVANGNARLNVSELNNGVYFLKMVANGNTTVEKVIVK